jgi:hypothetical protein
VEPRELVRLLRNYAKVKAGSFSWRTPSSEGEIGLYPKVKKSNRDGFECRVNTVRYRKPGGSFFAEDGLHIITLQGSRVRVGETLVLIKCQEPKAGDSVFGHFCVEMDGLRQELTKPLSTVEQAYPELVVPETAQQAEEPMPVTEHTSAGRPGAWRFHLPHPPANHVPGRKRPRERSIQAFLRTFLLVPPGEFFIKVRTLEYASQSSRG